ncbi:MAG TPA: anti-sigma factor domain-containing protein, partial [Patescibacteria group bacterium]|nr:anti-sigma factor domain-containing protein [Patescibacteria group bacterium]
MKGIIAEVHGSYMIVIAKNGNFIKCKKLPNCNIGDEINIPARNMNSIYKKLTTVAASFLILAMLSSGVYAYYTP